MVETHAGKVWCLTVHVRPPARHQRRAVHIQPGARALASSGVLSDVTIVDPRTAFRLDERFRREVLIAEWPDVRARRLGIDHATPPRALTHDPKMRRTGAHPQPLARGGDCFYLFYRRGWSRRRTRAASNGSRAGLVRMIALARIHAPIGLALVAVSPPRSSWSPSWARDNVQLRQFPEQRA